MTEAIIVALVGLAGMALSAYIGVRAGRKKNDADAAGAITEAATKLIDPLNERIDELKVEIEQLRSKVNAKDRRIAQLECAVRERDSQIAQLQAEATKKDAELSELKARVEELERGARHDTAAGGDCG